MARIQHKLSKAAHIACADKPHTPSDPETTRAVMRAWGLEYLRRCGWKIPDMG